MPQTINVYIVLKNHSKIVLFDKYSKNICENMILCGNKNSNSTLIFTGYARLMIYAALKLSHYESRLLYFDYPMKDFNIFDKCMTIKWFLIKLEKREYDVSLVIDFVDIYVRE